MTLIEKIKSARSILIVGHVRPDGDCLGAGFAIKRIAEGYGKSARLVVDSPAPAAYSFISGYDELVSAGNETGVVCSNYDLAIAVDCGDRTRLGKYYSLYEKIGNTINIDHHKTNDRFAKINFVDKDKSSTCEIIFDLIKDDCEMTSEVATLLYLGLSTDTGNFMHSNTTPSALLSASQLLERGADLEKIVNKFYKNNSIGKLYLIARTIEGMRFFRGGEIVVMTVTKKMLHDCDCVMADTEGIIDYGMSIGSVRVAVCMSEQRENSYKVSFRSKDVDVCAAAAVFGGGGHVRAAGCVANGFYEDVVRKVVRAIEDGMAE